MLSIQPAPRGAEESPAAVGTESVGGRTRPAAKNAVNNPATPNRPASPTARKKYCASRGVSECRRYGKYSNIANRDSNTAITAVGSKTS